MKNFVKILIASFAITALLLAAGCKNEPDSPAATLPTDINVTVQGGGAIPATLAVDAALTLTVTAVKATSYDWEVNDSSVIQIVSGATAATATFKGLKTGQAKITAYARNGQGNIKKEISIEVIALPALSITLKDGNNTVNAGSTIDINKDDEKTFTTEVNVAGGAAVTDATIVWESAHPERVAVTNSGKVTAISAGSSVVTVTASKTGYASAHIEFSVNVIDLNLPFLAVVVTNAEGTVTNGDNIDLEEGLTMQFTVKAFAGANDVTSDVDIEWHSYAPEFATVSADGLVTAVSRGETVISVFAEKPGEYNSGHLEFTINVTQIDPNVLFLWDNTGPGFGSGTAAMTSSGHSWVHPDANKFMAQKDNVRVTTLRTFGNGIRTASDPDTAILLGVGVGSNNNPRLAIGQTENTATGTHTAATDPAGINFGGQIDLYRKQARLIIDYKDAHTTSGYLLRVYIGNNGTGEGQSIFGTASNLGTYRDPAHPGTGAFHNILQANPGNTLAAGRVILNIDTTTETFTSLANEAYLANTFIVLHTQGGTAQNAKITITGIRLEFIPPSAITGVSISGSGVSGTPKTLTLEAGAVVTLNANRVPLNAVDGSIEWSTSNATVATVDAASGLVTAVVPGTATITATLSGVAGGPFTDTVSVTVTPPKGDVNVGINPEAVFNGFPTAEFTLSISNTVYPVDNPITLEVSADWYINGVSKVTDSSTYTVDSADWPFGVTHNLTVFITASNGELYSKSVTFMVTE